jgi:hypothetical protein
VYDLSDFALTGSVETNSTALSAKASLFLRKKHGVCGQTHTSAAMERE